MANNGITAAALREHLNQMATVAANTRDSWESTTTTPSTSDRPTQAGRKPSTGTTQRSLIGTWIGSTNGQAFALQLKADRTFVLAVVQGTNQTRSAGKFTFDNTGRMTLQGNDGTKLSGKATITSGDAFQLALDGGTTLKLKRSK